jgi:hypothetical protein
LLLSTRQIMAIVRDAGASRPRSGATKIFTAFFSLSLDPASAPSAPPAQKPSSRSAGAVKSGQSSKCPVASTDAGRVSSLCRFTANVSMRLIVFCTDASSICVSRTSLTICTIANLHAVSLRMTLSARLTPAYFTLHIMLSILF